MMKRERLSSRATAAADRAILTADRPSRPASPHGAPLDSALRGAFEPRFHFDFSHVQIHHDAEAHGVASDVGARAVTMGSDIYFADGAYDPATVEGTELVAHELAHVVQRENAGTSSGILSHASDTAEVEASRAAESAVVGGEVSLGAAPAAVAREEEESDSIFQRIAEKGELLKAPEETGVAPFLGVPKGPLDAVKQISGLLGMFGGADKALEGAEKGDLLQTISGSTGLVGGGLGLAGWGAETFGGNAEFGGALGGVGGLFSAGSNVFDAIGHFRNGETGKGVLDSGKAAAGGMSGLATLGGFELFGTEGAAWMEAGSAFTGGAGEGLAYLGAPGAVLGSGLAGYGLGTAGLGLANNYARKNDIFGDHRDSTEAAADAGVAVQEYLHSTWVPDVVGDVAGGVTAVGSSIGTAAYSGLHAAGSAVSDFFTGPSIFDVIQQQARSEEWAKKMKEDD